MLSAVSQQIQMIQESLKEHKHIIPGKNRDQEIGKIYFPNKTTCSTALVLFIKSLTAAWPNEYFYNKIF